MARLIEDSTVDVLVVCHMFRDLPLLVDELKVLAKLLPASIAFTEGEIFP